MSNQDFFQSIRVIESDFFDEGPVITPAIAAGINTGSIETSRIDGYRQGVEITLMKHFDAGLGKIHAGEPGHVLRKNRFGMDKNFMPAPEFQELDYFNPIKFMEAQDNGSYLYDSIFTFPIITGDNVQIENYTYNGTIEPLSIRSVASFYSIDAPFEAHSVRGEVMGSSPDQTSATSYIVTVNDFDAAPDYIEFLDMVDMIDASTPLQGYFRPDKSKLKPFVDQRDPRNVLYSSRQSDMNNALSLMTGSSDNYVSYKQVSATSGWDFDVNSSVGTDSLAFGGMTY